MTDTILAIAFIMIFIVGPFWLIRKMDKRISKKGALFSGKVTPGMRVFAVVLGILFAGMFIMELLSSQTIHLLFLILALALIGYGLGAGQLLKKFQTAGANAHSTYQPSSNNESAIESLDHNEMKSLLQNRFIRSGIRLAIILGVSIVVIYGAWWASIHPNNSLTLIFVIGVIIIVGLATVLHWFGFLGQLFKKKSNPEALSDYLKWRDVVFSATSAQVDVVTDQPDQVFGAIMDVGLSDDFIITITAFPTGELSLRTTVGGGAIGLGSDEIIAEHAKRIVTLAQSLIENARQIDNHNLPKSQKVYFYFLTTSGLMLSETTVEETSAPSHLFHEMFGRFTEIKSRSEELTMVQRR